MSCDEDDKNIICLLTSPKVIVSERHCMQFHYFFTNITTQLAFFVINEDTAENGRDAFSSLGSIQSDTKSSNFVKVREWQKGQVELPPGIYKVLITASDVAGFSATRLRNITISKGGCGYNGKIRCNFRSFDRPRIM